MKLLNDQFSAFLELHASRVRVLVQNTIWRFEKSIDSLRRYILNFQAILLCTVHVFGHWISYLGEVILSELFILLAHV